MSNITKNGFYKLSEFEGEKINIAKDLVVCIFDDAPPPNLPPSRGRDITISLGKNSKVELYGFQESSDVGHCNTSKIHVLQCHTGSKLKINYLLLGNKKNQLKKEIKSCISASNVGSNVKILSLVMNDGFIDLDGIIDIGKGLEKVEGNLEEENLFLGTSGKVRGIPTLLVASDDVKASHSCKMERISDEQLFYLRSRGIEKESAVSMMIEAKVESLFSGLSMYNKDFYEKLVNSILNKIK